MVGPARAHCAARGSRRIYRERPVCRSVRLRAPRSYRCSMAASSTLRSEIQPPSLLLEVMNVARKSWKRSGSPRSNSWGRMMPARFRFARRAAACLVGVQRAYRPRAFPDMEPALWDGHEHGVSGGVSTHQAPRSRWGRRAIVWVRSSAALRGTMCGASLVGSGADGPAGGQSMVR